MSNSKKTKRALLSGVMAMVLSVAMLIGTTFAWFTDSASAGASKIQAGTLDVQLLDANGQSVENGTLTWETADGRTQDQILWEPGCTYQLQPVTIKNNGNLTLKYKIKITGINGSEKLNEAIEWKIQVGDSIVALDTYEGKLTADGSSDVLVISGHMKESATNEYQGLSIDSIAITVLATQDTKEYDSATDQYDADAQYAAASIDGLAEIGAVTISSAVETVTAPIIMQTASATISSTAEEGTLIEAKTGSKEGVVTFAPQSADDTFFAENNEFNVTLDDDVTIKAVEKGNSGIVLGNAATYDANGVEYEGYVPVAEKEAENVVSYRATGKTLNVTGGTFESYSGEGNGAICVTNMSDCIVNISDATFIIGNSSGSKNAAVISLDTRGERTQQGYYFTDTAVKNTAVTFTNCTFKLADGTEIDPADTDNEQFGRWFYGFGGESGNTLTIDGTKVIE